MSKESTFILVDTERACKEAHQLFTDVSQSLEAILPQGVEILHVGATAVPGCLTKGDLDVVVRIPAHQFAYADATLAARFHRNDGSINTETFSAFEDASAHPHLGIQLAAIGGPFDFFHLFAEQLQQSPQLVQEYNALKRLHDGADMTIYRAAKDAFVKKVLAELGWNK